MGGGLERSARGGPERTICGGRCPPAGIGVGAAGAGETEAPAVAPWCCGCWGRPDAASATDQRSGGAWCPVTLARPRRRTGPHLQHSRPRRVRRLRHERQRQKRRAAAHQDGARGTRAAPRPAASAAGAQALAQVLARARIRWSLRRRNPASTQIRPRES